MLKELKFVMGAVSKKDLLPALTHFRIQDGTVRSYNGMLALSTPIALNIDCVPKAEPLVKAIQNCEDTVSLTITPAGRLSVKSGPFKALIECVQEETPHVMPEGVRIDFDGEILLAALKSLSPFISNDASRPWSNGILFDGCSAFATNNVILVEYWVGVAFPVRCTIPRAAVKEMLRIGEPPLYAQSTENSMTFHYSDDRWLRTQLLSTDWPDVSKILNVPGNLTLINEDLFPKMEKLKPFADKLGRVYMTPDLLCTHANTEDGATCEIENLPFTIKEGENHGGIYQIEMFMLLNKVALTIDLTQYPKPCPFQGDRIRGVIVGMRP